MQKEDIEFDLLVRSKLARAEEEVPPQVWDKIAERLDKAARPAPVPWWRGVAMAVASVAAVALLGVFLFFRENTPGQHPDALAQVDVVPSEGLLTDVPAEATEPAAEAMAAVAAEAPEAVYRPSALPASSGAVSDGSRVRRAAPKAPVKTEVASAEEIILTENPVVEELLTETPVAEETVTDEPVAEIVAEEPEVEAVREESSPAADVDPFARMAWEDSQARKSRSGISLMVGGDLQTNGNPQAIRTSGTRRAMIAGAPSQTSVNQISRASTYSVPVSAGIGVRIPFAPKWSVGTGVSWSMLERTFTGTYTEVGETPRSITADIRHTLHYIGIPVNVYFDILSGGRVDFYAFAGGTVEKAIVSHYRIPDASGNIDFREKVPGVQWSAAAGLGIEFHLSPLVGLYVDPSLRYYFPGDQPVSIRTQQPLMMGLEAGLRFDF